MANKKLFASARALPRTDALNCEAAPAYAYTARHKLAQLAATGTLQENFYGDADAQLAAVIELVKAVDPIFVAKTAIYARSTGAMKDMPALLTAWLTVGEPDLAVRVFNRVIDNGRMLRSFVQIMRSGAVGRASLGTRPKRLVQQWLEKASLPTLMRAATGNDPSLSDIVKMVHPRPADGARSAFYGWLIGRPYDVSALPGEVAAFENWKRDRSGPLPHVPFEWLTSEPLTIGQWVGLTEQMGWQTLRMNLNTLLRRGVFEVEGMAERIAAILADPVAQAKARVMPYQLLAAIGKVDGAVPLVVQLALEEALDRSLGAVPVVPGRVVVAPDVSGSMCSPMTGYRKGASSKVRCIDVAALFAVALARRNPGTLVMPFAEDVVPFDLDPEIRVTVNTMKLAGIGGGGTNVSAPLARLNANRSNVDLVVFVSDNQSWVDARCDNGSTQTMSEWSELKKRCPAAKLVCIDLQPHGTTQAREGTDVLNIGGFSDAVFETIARFTSGQPAKDWVAEVMATEV